MAEAPEDPSVEPKIPAAEHAGVCLFESVVKSSASSDNESEPSISVSEVPRACP